MGRGVGAPRPAKKPTMYTGAHLVKTEPSDTKYGEDDRAGVAARRLAETGVSPHQPGRRNRTSANVHKPPAFQHTIAPLGFPEVPQFSGRLRYCPGTLL